MKNAQYLLLSVGYGGTVAEAVNCHTSGGSLESYLPQTVLGAWVLDKRPAIDKHGPGVVFSAPLVNVALADDVVDRIDVTPGTSIVADTLAKDCPNAFGSVVRGARAGVMNLDTVSTRGCVAYWRRYGAKVGRVTTSGILWEPAAVEAPVETQLSLLGGVE